MRPQPLVALDRAQDVRALRSRLKRDLSSGEARLTSLLISPPEWAQTMALLDVLRAMPWFGRIKADRVLLACRIEPTTRLEQLALERRTAVLDRLRWMYPVVWGRWARQWDGAE